MSDFDHPSDAVIIRFGSHTPFFLLTLSFGIFRDYRAKIDFTSLDAYIGYNMLAQPEHRSQMIQAPNGWIAHRNLMGILQRGSLEDGSLIVRSGWEEEREEILRRGLLYKYTQNLLCREILLNTKRRPIFDDSRSDEFVFCIAGGQGQNLHGKLLEEIRQNPDIIERDAGS